MNMKCLIEILKEKKYVKELDQSYLGQKPCILTLKTDYDIVIQKIMESVDDDYFTYHENKDRITIVNLRENCLDEINPISQAECDYYDYVTIRKYFYIFGRAINDYIEDYEADFAFSDKRIVNCKVRKNRLAEEEKKELEVIEFINSLP